MNTYFLVVIAVIGSLLPLIFLARSFKMTKNLQRAQVQQDVYFRNFLEKTGYRLAEMPDAPLEQQVQALCQRYANPSAWQQGFHLDYVKLAYGKRVELQLAYRGASAATRWRVALEAAPPLTFHLLRDAKRAPAFSERVTLGDPAWDKRFKIYSEQPELLRQILPASGLRELLEPWLSVDLLVSAREVVFTDATNRNINAAMGGLMGQMLTAADPDKNEDLLIPVYNQITDLVLLAASLQRPA